MKPEKQRSPWRWLLLIPIQLVIVLLLFLLGIGLDRTIFSGGGQGHGAPIFSVLLPMIGLGVTVLVAIVALTGLIVGLIRRGRRRKRAGVTAPQGQTEDAELERRDRIAAREEMLTRAQSGD